MRYGVTLVVAASIYIEVEADSKEEAMDKASEHDDCYVSLCYQCSQGLEVGDVLCDDEANHVEELEANPT